MIANHTMYVPIFTNVDSCHAMLRVARDLPSNKMVEDVEKRVYTFCEQTFNSRSECSRRTQMKKESCLN